MLDQERDLVATLRMEMKLKGDTISKLQDQLAELTSDLSVRTTELEFTKAELLSVNRDLRQSETRSHELIEKQVAHDKAQKILQRDFSELSLAHQKLEYEMKSKNAELETMRNEREHEISNNLEEIQKIEKNYQKSV